MARFKAVLATTNSFPSCGLCILAGGLSSRMGRDKARLRLGSRTVRARLLGAEERLLSYPWSSFTWYLAAATHRPAWMRVGRLLGEHGLAGDTAEARQEFERRMETRRAQEADDAEWEPLRRGWCPGGSGLPAGIAGSHRWAVG